MNTPNWQQPPPNWSQQHPPNWQQPHWPQQPQAAQQKGPSSRRVAIGVAVGMLGSALVIAGARLPWSTANGSNVIPPPFGQDSTVIFVLGLVTFFMAAFRPLVRLTVYRALVAGLGVICGETALIAMSRLPGGPDAQLGPGLIVAAVGALLVVVGCAFG